MRMGAGRLETLLLIAGAEWVSAGPEDTLSDKGIRCVHRPGGPGGPGDAAGAWPPKFSCLTTADDRYLLVKTLELLLLNFVSSAGVWCSDGKRALLVRRRFSLTCLIRLIFVCLAPMPSPR